jgi:DNA-directed RNA polymerase specialized sigma24 family protein
MNDASTSCGAGDPRDWEECRKRFECATLPHLAHIFSTALRLTDGRAEAEKLALETYSQAFSSFHELEPHWPPDMWLCAILLQVLSERSPRKRTTGGGFSATR